MPNQQKNEVTVNEKLQQELIDLQDELTYKKLDDYEKQCGTKFYPKSFLEKIDDEILEDRI